MQVYVQAFKNLELLIGIQSVFKNCKNIHSFIHSSFRVVESNLFLLFMITEKNEQLSVPISQ